MRDRSIFAMRYAISEAEEFFSMNNLLQEMGETFAAAKKHIAPTHLKEHHELTGHDTGMDYSRRNTFKYMKTTHHADGTKSHHYSTGITHPGYLYGKRHKPNYVTLHEHPDKTVTKEIVPSHYGRPW